MDAYRIWGGKPATGEINISGNKNSALPLIAATLLTDESVTLSNVPKIQDVKTMLSLIKSLGSKVEMLDEHTIKITSGNRKNYLTDEKVALVRGSILFLGPLLACNHKVEMSPPGGDVIGLRRVDTHFMGFEKIGAKCSITDEGTLLISCDKIKGSEIFLEEASVTATENIIMACSLTEENFIIQNAACEPHIQDLCMMLNLMGCKIEGIGSNLLKIKGRKKLKGCYFNICSDYMEVGSFIGLAAATGGEVLLHKVNHQHLKILELGFSKIGIEFKKVNESDLLIPQKQNRIISKSFDGMTNKIDDAPWPGFPADLLSIMTVCATQMKGTILMHEKMFESRMYFVDWLIRMGADIILCDPHRAVITGPSRLHSAKVSSPDVRAGMALVIAAACCDGESTIDNIIQIERGYENLEKKLSSLGIYIVKESKVKKDD